MNLKNGTEAAQFPEKEYINWIFVVVQYLWKSVKRLQIVFNKKIKLPCTWVLCRPPAWRRLALPACPRDTVPLIKNEKTTLYLSSLSTSSLAAASSASWPRDTVPLIKNEKTTLYLSSLSTSSLAAASSARRASCMRQAQAWGQVGPSTPPSSLPPSTSWSSSCALHASSTVSAPS